MPSIRDVIRVGRDHRRCCPECQGPVDSIDDFTQGGFNESWATCVEQGHRIGRSRSPYFDGREALRA